MSKIVIADELKLRRGYVTLIKGGEGGGEEDAEKENLITDSGNIILGKATAGIVELDGNVDISLGINDAAPTPGDTVITSPFATRTATMEYDEIGNSLVFTAEFFGTWTGDVKEAGLIHQTEGMISRVNITFSKSFDEIYTIKWTITV